MDYLFALASLLLCIVTLLPIWQHEAWWVRGLDFPRLQFFSLAALILILEALLLNPWLASSVVLMAIAVSCLAYQGWWILPYTRLHPVEVKAAPAHEVEGNNTVKIMTANVLASNREARKLIEQVRAQQPDILVTLESNHWWQKQLDALQEQYPFAVKCPLDNLYGMHVYSRLELLDSQVEYLVEQDVPSIHTQIRLACGDTVRAHFLHPAPPSPVENEQSIERDVELLAVAKSLAGTTEPVIVAGDLNDVAWSQTTRLFRKISGLLDPRIGRGMFNTFHAKYWPVRWPLDHLFHSRHFRLQHIKRLRIAGSDHFALLTCLVYQPQQNNGEAILSADTSDIATANDKLAKKQVSAEDVPRPDASADPGTRPL